MRRRPLRPVAFSLREALRRIGPSGRTDGLSSPGLGHDHGTVLTSGLPGSLHRIAVPGRRRKVGHRCSPESWDRPVPASSESPPSPLAGHEDESREPQSPAPRHRARRGVGALFRIRSCRCCVLSVTRRSRSVEGWCTHPAVEGRGRPFPGSPRHGFRGHREATATDYKRPTPDDRTTGWPTLRSLYRVSDARVT